MTGRPDLATLLPPIEAVDALPPELVPGFIAGLAALQTRAAARLVAVPAPFLRRPREDGATADAHPDDYLTTAEAAALLKVSAKWIYRRSSRLPFVHKLSRRELRCSRRGLERYMAGRRA